MPAAVLMELEGVIVDTRALRADALRRSLDEIGMPVDEAAVAQDFTGLPPRERAMALLGRRCAFADETELDLVELRAEREFAARVAQGLSLAEGALDCLALLQGQAPLALVTRASRRVTDMVLALSGLEGTFACIVTADDAKAMKPFPAPYELAIARLARRGPLEAGHCLALEDSIAGIRAAKRARLRCVAIGAIPPGEAMEASADAWLPSLAGQSAQTLASLLRKGEKEDR